MLTTLILFAQEKVADKAPQTDPGIGGLFTNPMMLLLVLMALFFFVVILPQQRKQRKEQ
jgi:hypothetical protein